MRLKRSVSGLPSTSAASMRIEDSMSDSPLPEFGARALRPLTISSIVNSGKLKPVPIFLNLDRNWLLLKKLFTKLRQILMWINLNEFVIVEKKLQNAVAKWKSVLSTDLRICEDMREDFLFRVIIWGEFFP